MKVTEATMQAILMHRAMEVINHDLVLTNTGANWGTFYSWEADLLSVTKSGLIHEYEIKLSKSDYNADFNKRHKHQLLSGAGTDRPNYFWYATYEFDIEPPDYAGWILVQDNEHNGRWRHDTWNGFEWRVMREAPRLHSKGISDRRRAAVGRLLSYRLKNAYAMLHTRGFRLTTAVEKQ